MIIADNKTVSFANLTPYMVGNKFRRSVSRMLFVDKTRNLRRRTGMPAERTATIKIKRSEMISTTM